MLRLTYQSLTCLTGCSGPTRLHSGKCQRYGMLPCFLSGPLQFFSEKARQDKSSGSHVAPSWAPGRDVLEVEAGNLRASALQSAWTHVCKCFAASTRTQHFLSPTHPAAWRYRALGGTLLHALAVPVVVVASGAVELRRVILDLVHTQAPTVLSSTPRLDQAGCGFGSKA